MYARKYYSKKTKENIQNIINNLINAFRELLKNTSWMDSATKKLAANKINEIKFKIFNDENILNDTVIEEYYKEVRICSR